MVCRCGDVLVLWSPRTSLISKFPCLLTLSPTHLDWPASVVPLLLLSRCGDWFVNHCLVCQPGEGRNKPWEGCICRGYPKLGITSWWRGVTLESHACALLCVCIGMTQKCYLFEELKRVGCDREVKSVTTWWTGLYCAHIGWPLMPNWRLKLKLES